MISKELAKELESYNTVDIEARAIAVSTSNPERLRSRPVKLFPFLFNDEVGERRPTARYKLQAFEWRMTKGKQPRRVKVRKPFRW